MFSDFGSLAYIRSASASFPCAIRELKVSSSFCMAKSIVPPLCLRIYFTRVRTAFTLHVMEKKSGHRQKEINAASINSVNRAFAVLKEKADETNFVDAPPDVLVGFIWELTKEVFSLGTKEDAEQRLQRNVATLIRQRQS